MALTAAEKQALYRKRRDADPLRRAEYLEKENRRWANKLAAGETKRIVSLSKKEQKQKRKYWLKATRKSRRAKAVLAENMTPPTSPEGGPEADPPGTANVPRPVSRCVYKYNNIKI